MPARAARKGSLHMSLESELAALHQPLLRFAQLQLRNESLAEDVVSETLLAILENPGQFEGRSSLRTYATGVLKFKIIDLLRKRGREVAIEPMEDQTMDEALDALFHADGHWVEPPQAWRQPEKSLEQSQFFRTLQDCIDRLPERQGKVFMMREWMEIDTGQICSELSISETNCNVLLYRARMQLRGCLDSNWFQSAV